MILGIILARGGSQRLPRKNVRLLAGRPLIAWTILAAQNAAMLDDYLVSSEDREIQEVAASCGAPVQVRPHRLAQHDTSSYDVLFHVLDASRQEWSGFVLLQPTSPFRTATDIDDAVEIFVKGNCSALASYEAGAKMPNGGIYIASPEWLRAGGNWDTSPDVLHYEMPAWRSIDINTEEDLARAERMMKSVA